MTLIGSCIFGAGMMLCFMPIQVYLIDVFTYAASAIAAATVRMSQYPQFAHIDQPFLVTSVDTLAFRICFPSFCKQNVRCYGHRWWLLFPSRSLDSCRYSFPDIPFLQGRRAESEEPSNTIDLYCIQASYCAYCANFYNSSTDVVSILYLRWPMPVTWSPRRPRARSLRSTISNPCVSDAWTNQTILRMVVEFFQVLIPRMWILFLMHTEFRCTKETFVIFIRNMTGQWPRRRRMR